MKNEVIAITVIQHLPIGLKVKLQDGREGIIRIREISWDEEKLQTWKECFPVDWAGEAVVLKDTENLELSLRLAEYDPWDKVGTEYKVGKVVKGTATGVVGYGVFVELMPGVTGLLHYKQLPKSINQSSLDLFWPGDRLFVKIKQIDTNKRRIGLDLARTGSDVQKDRSKSGGTSEPQIIATSLSSPSIFDEYLKEDHPPKHFLVVEDSDDQAAAITTWLEKMMHRASCVSDGEKALDLIEVDMPDIIFVDLGLPGMNGIEVIQAVQKHYPEIGCILATDWSRREAYLEDIQALESAGVQFLMKPLMSYDLIRVIRNLDTQNHQLLNSGADGNLVNGAAILKDARRDIKDQIEALIDVCREKTGFDRVILFSLDTVKRVVNIEFSSGSAYIQEQVVPDLIYSPVRDSAEDGQLIVVEKLPGKMERQFQYLLKFFPLSACLCVPIQSTGIVRRTLVLLNESPRKITRETVLYVEGMALTINALFEKMLFQEQAIGAQRKSLMGELTGGLLHEINNRISTLFVSIENLKGMLRREEKQGAIGEGRANINTQVEHIQKEIIAVTQMAKQYGQLVRRPKDQFLRLDELVDNAMIMLGEKLKNARVKISNTQPESMMIVQSQSIAIEQVLLNILLNAIQQIQNCPYCERGVIQILYENDLDEKDRMIYRILIEDNGPGIHKHLWDQIFEPGFTTRQDGSGMGLYISRRLMEKIDGKLYVHESCILGGSVFAIELPAGIEKMGSD